MSNAQWDIRVRFWRDPWPSQGSIPDADVDFRYQADNFDVAEKSARSRIDFEPAAYAYGAHTMSDIPVRQISDNAKIIEKRLDELCLDATLPMATRAILAELSGRAQWIRTVLADKP